MDQPLSASMRHGGISPGLMLLPMLAIAACGGGGGGGGMTQPPPTGGSSEAIIKQDNATLAVALGNAFLESPVQLALSALDNVFALGDSRQLSFDMRCDNFSTGGRMVLVDNDGDGLVSAGDIVELDYNNCRQAALGDFASGRINVEIVGLSIAADLSTAGQAVISLPNTLTFGSGNNSFVDVSGAFSVAFTATTSIDNLDISTAATQSLKNVLRDSSLSSTETANQLSVSRRVSAGIYTITGSSSLDSQSMGGRFSCNVSTELSGTLAQFPESGSALTCMGRNRSAARVVATAGGGIVTEVDPEGDGSFVDAGVMQNGNGTWGDYIEGQLFTTLLQRPRLDPSQLIPSAASSKLAIAAGDAVVDAVYDDASGRLYVITNGGVEVIDLATMAIADSLALAGRPGSIDISDDGSTLWIGLRDLPEIFPVDSGSLTEGAHMALGMGAQIPLPRIASDIQVAPGSIDTVVVATQDTREVLAVAAGMQLPGIVEDANAATVIEFADASTVLGVRGTSTLFAASQMRLDANGVTLLKALPRYSDGFTSQMAVTDNTIWVPAGRAIDVAGERILGRFDMDQAGNFLSARTVSVDTATNTAWFYDPTSRILVFFDTGTFTWLGAYRLSATMGTKAWSFGTGTGDLLLVLDNEVHRIDRSTLTPTVSDRGCPTLDLGGQLGSAVFLQIDCPFNDTLYDASRNLLYASLGSSAGSKGNSLAIIEPQTGTVQAYIYVGSEPGSLAISADAARLYVGLREANAVAEVDLASQQLLSSIRLGDEISFISPSFSAAIATTTPGPPDFVVATAGEIAAYSAGMRAMDVYDRASRVEDLFYGSAATPLFGVTESGTIWSFDVAATGVTNGVETRGLLAVRGARGKGDFIYDRLGKIVDARIPAVVASCPQPAAVAVVPDPSSDDVYYLRPGVDNEMLVCDQISQTITRSFTVPSFGGGYFFPRLTVSGPDRIAITNSDKMVLLDPAGP